MIHYHGTPITPRAALLTLAGRCFCVSFADPRDIDVCHEIGQSVMLDNGAYTAHTEGRPTDWPGYYEWCSVWLAHWTTWAVIPDVIGGDEDKNDELLAEWPFGTRGAPVWHMHESLDRLERLTREWPLVCIGSSGAFWKIASPPWRRRMADAMEAACDAGAPRTRLHLLRGLAFSVGPYPLFSADSTDVARNHAGIPSRGVPPKLPSRMADYIDSRQPPTRWVPVAEQMPIEEETTCPT